MFHMKAISVIISNKNEHSYTIFWDVDHFLNIMLSMIQTVFLSIVIFSLDMKERVSKRRLALGSWWVCRWFESSAFDSKAWTGDAGQGFCPSSVTDQSRHHYRVPFLSRLTRQRPRILLHADKNLSALLRCVLSKCILLSISTDEI